MNTRKFWPLDYDPEGEIYESVVWDLPGFRRVKATKAKVKADSGVEPRPRQRRSSR
jgi:hypothetical protein